jgi:hypothetical protein
MKDEGEGWILLKAAGKTRMYNTFFHNIVVA